MSKANFIKTSRLIKASAVKLINKQTSSPSIEPIRLSSGAISSFSGREKSRAKVKGRLVNRPDWDTYFMDLAVLVSKRATCLRRMVGAVIVKDRHVLSTGYNGAPKGIKHCFYTGCLRQQLKIQSGHRHELCRGLHAEQNAIIQAALYGVSLKGAVLYCTNMPCAICAKMIINAGIVAIVAMDGYADGMAKGFLKEARIKVTNIKNRQKK